MDMLLLGYQVLLIICCIFTLGVTIYTYVNKKGLLSKSLTLLALTSFLFTLVLLIAIIFDDPQISIFFASLQFAIFTAACSIWAVFILRFLKINENKFDKYVWLLYIFPIALVIISFINIFTPILLTGTGIYNTEIGPFGYMVYMYTLTLMMVIIFILLINYSNIKHAYRKSILIMLIVPSLTSIPSFFTFGTPFYEFSITAVTYTVGIALLFYCMYLTKVMDINVNIDSKIINSINVGMLFFDLDDKLAEYNAMMAKLFHLDDSVIGLSFDEIIKWINYPEELIKYYYDGETKPKQFQIDDNIWVDISRHDVYDDKEYLGSLFTIYNISKLKAAEINAIQADKEANMQSHRLDNRNKDIVILLQEVHHRVKNNLQLILSFINLDRRFDNEESAILEDTINRIASMALIYQSSYKKGNYTSIDIGNLAFDICESLKKTYLLENLTINYNIDPNVIVDMDIVSPLGLIYNELVGNAFKHAFDEDQTDKLLNIFVKKIDDTKAYIFIEDNGKGLPKEMNVYSPGTLGFTIINSLTNQIRGKFEIIECSGTAFKVEFPIGD